MRRVHLIVLRTAAAMVVALWLAVDIGRADNVYRVAFVGDSLNCNVLVRPTELYPEQVSRILGNIAVQNLGRPGGTISNVPGSIFKGWVEMTSAVNAIGGWFPLSAVVVLVGTNDWAEGQPATVVEGAYRAFVNHIHPSTKVVCVTPPWRRDEGKPNRIGETMGDVRAAITRACAKRGVVIDGAALIPHEARFYIDPVHPNAKGSRYLAEGVAKVLHGVLEN